MTAIERFTADAGMLFGAITKRDVSNVALQNGMKGLVVQFLQIPEPFRDAATPTLEAVLTQYERVIPYRITNAIGGDFS